MNLRNRKRLTKIRVGTVCGLYVKGDWVQGLYSVRGRRGGTLGFKWLRLDFVSVGASFVLFWEMMCQCKSKINIFVKKYKNKIKLHPYEHKKLMKEECEA